LHDSIGDLNAALAVKVDLARAVRGDRGHFDGASAAARNWDANDAVTATCSRCHGGEQGFRFFVRHGVGVEVQETANGLECTTCHSKLGDGWDVLAVANTAFPGGRTVALPGNDNLCSTCHVGRTSKADIDAAVARRDLRFLNVHYAPAASVRQGAATAVGYEYEGRTYAGPLVHKGGVQCTSCHDAKASGHSFVIADAWDARCKTCHADANGVAAAVRDVHRADYDGDGRTNEPLSGELDGLADRLLATLAQQGKASGGLCYSSAAFPYFFKDMDGDGQPLCAPAEAVAANRFTAWTPALMRAAHNYQLSRKDKGAWAHNFAYVAQLLYDSISDLGGDSRGLVRP
jgi:predicted CXXCH cytochrome family protein